MKRVFTTFALLLLCFIGYNQVTTNSATGANTTQDASGTITWTIEDVTASQTANDGFESILADLLGALGSSNTLSATSFSFASFPATDGVTSASLVLDLDQNSGVSVSIDLTVRVIRINGGETTLLNYNSTESLPITSGIITFPIDETSGWVLTGLTGSDLNSSTFRVEIEIEILAAASYDFGVDRIELQFTTEAPLPVEWGDFNATSSKEGTHLKWTTEVESNNAYFALEKSPNAKAWKAFGEVKGAGNSFTRKKYEITDITPFIPISYYRIKQVDFDGTYAYSKILSVSVESHPYDEPIVVNPAIGSFIIKYPQNALDDPLEVRLIDYSGRILHCKRVDKGETSFAASTTLPSGSYFLVIKDKLTQQSWTKQVVYVQE